MPSSFLIHVKRFPNPFIPIECPINSYHAGTHKHIQFSGSFMGDAPPYEPKFLLFDKVFRKYYLNIGWAPLGITAPSYKKFYICPCSKTNNTFYHVLLLIFLFKYSTNKEASWLHAELFFVLVSMWLPQQHMVSIWTPHGIHVETLWCPVEIT